MRRNFKIFSLFMGLFVCFTAFVGCNKGGVGANKNGEIKAWQGRGVHTAQVTPTEKYIVKEGKTDYKLLLPASPTEYETAAATLITEYMFLSLGINIPIQ